jgi:predicted dienelactone hydrolase
MISEWLMSWLSGDSWDAMVGKILGWGTWTRPQDITSVVTGPTSVHAKFVWDQPREHDIAKAANEPQANRKRADDFSIEQDGIDTTLSPQLLFNQQNAINPTAFEDIDPETQQPAFIVPRPTPPRTSIGRIGRRLASRLKSCNDPLLL